MKSTEKFTLVTQPQCTSKNLGQKASSKPGTRRTLENMILSVSSSFGDITRENTAHIMVVTDHNKTRETDPQSQVNNTMYHGEG